MGNKISKKRMARSSGQVPMHYTTGVSNTDYPGVATAATTTTSTIPPYYPPPVTSHTSNAPRGPVNMQPPPPPPAPPPMPAGISYYKPRY